MSNPNEYVTHAELYELLSAISVMMDEKLERTENRMKMYIENGVQKQVNMLGEKMTNLESHQEAMKTQLDTLSEDMQEVKIRLGGVETRLDGVETRLDGVETRLDGVEARLDGVEARLSNVEHDVKELKADMKEVKAAVAEHDEEIITLRRVRDA